MSENNIELGGGTWINLVGKWTVSGATSMHSGRPVCLSVCLYIRFE